ncbi:MAG TPA: beta-propeller fold lactonase family protein [Candidatus Angelobacter sp.]|jgi:YVTN family beta-propeller protein|nr:beta-propeller fold lactonase family protein [Candidatus Angelobacter sp.]
MSNMSIFSRIMCRIEPGIFVGLALVVFLVLPAKARAQSPNVYVTNNFSNTVSVIDPATHNLVTTISGFNSPVGVAVSPDGTRVYVVNSNPNPGTVSVINTATNTIIATITVGNGATLAAMSPDGKHVYVPNSNAGTVSVIDTGTNRVTATVTVGGAPVGVVVTPDNAHVYIANFSNSVNVVATATNTVTANITHSSMSGPLVAAITPDGKTVYVSNEISNKITVISTATNVVTAVIPVGQIPDGLAVTPDGTRLYVSNGADSTVSVISTATNTVTLTIPGFNGPQGMAVTGDGAQVFVTNTVADTVSAISTATNKIAASSATGQMPSFAAIFQCHILTFSFNPATVRLGNSSNLNATIRSCSSSTQNVVFNWTMTGPCVNQSGSTPMVVTPGSSQNLSFPITMACTGQLILTVTTILNGVQIDSESAVLTVTP